MPDFEAIVIDDGSTDGTDALVAAFDPRIVLLRQDHAERSAARNAGLAVARGRYVAFLDDDDVFLPDKLARQAAFLDDRPGIDLLYSPCFVMDIAGRKLDLRPLAASPLPAGDPLPHLLTSNAIPMAGVLARRTAIAAAGGFRTDLSFGEDWDLWLRLVTGGAALAHLPGAVAAYRLHSRGLLPAPDGLHKVLVDRRTLLTDALARAPESRVSQAQRRVIRAQHAGTEGLMLAALGNPEAALPLLRQAAALDAPHWANKRWVRLTVAELALGYVDGRPGETPRAMLETLCRALPEEIGVRVRDASAALAIVQAFRSHDAGHTREASDHARDPVRSDPTWLTNRGVISLLLQGLRAGPDPAEPLFQP
jgi:hypothetical protein